MKKVLLALFALSQIGLIRAETLVDQFYLGFVGNAKFAIESTTDGTTHPEFLDNFIEIGRYSGGHIAAVDFGALGTILPDSAQVDAVDWTTGFKFHLSPLINNSSGIPLEFTFLRNMEVDLRASYNWTEHHPFYGIVAAYPFK